MTHKRLLILLGITLPTLLCCYVAFCGLAGIVWQQSSSVQAKTATADSSLAVPDRGMTPPRGHALAAERRTALQASRATLPQRDLLDLARRLQGISLAPASSTSPPAYALGDRKTFWLHNVEANSYFTATASLQYETPHAYWWIEDGYSVSARDLERSADRFENRTYPTNRRLFGSEWAPGIDNDPHVYIFLGNIPGVGGYFSSPDEFPAEIRAESNEHELFYINLDNARPGNDYFDGILAHEFQHMIHWAVDRDEETWVNEGLSELAAQINGYDVGGSDWVFTQNPETQLTTWPELEDSGPHYGASYLFLAYFFDQFGEDALQQLAAEPANGAEGFDAVLTRLDVGGRRFADLFDDWVVANYLDDPHLANGRYGYDELEVERPRHAAFYTRFPVERQTMVDQYAADYIVLRGEGNLELEFKGDSVVPLLGNQAHSGDYQWWAKRGDEGDATLTRTFDLTGLEQATLQVWMWYALEADYDYAYVELSSDGGQTWDLLGNGHTTTANPNGNSYGPAFTGLSGGGDKPQWVQEQFDLSQYAGQEILLRFEVITDDTINLPGLALDDISIPELGYHSDVETDERHPSGTEGWQAEGWVRVTDQIPQEFSLQLITYGPETRVERLPLDSQNRASITVAGLGHEIDRAVLVVSAQAPLTTEPAGYSYRITAD